MSAITETADVTFRDYVIPEDPSSGAYFPDNPDIRNLFGVVDTTVTDSIEEALQQPRATALYGEIATRSVDTNLSGSPVPADIGQIFVGNTVESADAITIDSGPNFPPGIAYRKYRGTPEAPTVVQPGDQLGYTDYRGYSGTQFWNTASIDAVVDAAIVFADGNLPPSKLRFATAQDNTGAKVRMEVLASGRVEIGAIEGSNYYGPTGVDPRFYVTTLANDWAMIIYAQPATGAGYAGRFHTLGQTGADYLLGGSSGVGTGSFKFSVRGNGDVYSSTGFFVETNQVVGARGAEIPDLSVTATSGTLPPATGAVLLVDAAAPTNAELLKYCVELEAKIEALLARVRASTGHGLIA